MKQQVRMQHKISAFLLIATGLLAQPEKTALLEPEKESYLERSHAIQKSEELQSRNIKDIQRLKILIANYGSKVSGSAAELEKIKEIYKKATESYYRREFVESRKLHEDCQQQIVKSYESFTRTFQEQLTALLTECSLSMSNAEFSQSLEPGQTSPSLNQIITRNQFKLRIAYSQLGLAENSIRDRNYVNAIDHYRLAKIYAISVLKGLAEDPQKKKELEDKYAVDLRDAMGRTQVSEKK